MKPRVSLPPRFQGRGQRLGTATVALFWWLLTMVLWSMPLSAGPFDLNDASWEGCTDFLHLARKTLGRDRVVVLAVLDWEQVQAGDGVMVLHPNQPLDASEAASFMKAGGRLAVVDDFGKGDQLLKHFRISRRALPTDPVQFLRDRVALAIATPSVDVDSSSEQVGVHPTVGDVKQVVLNHGSGLEHPNLTPVLEVRSDRSKPVAVAVAGQIEGESAKGRLFAMGDPSALMNRMLRYPGNRAFAEGLVKYLANGDSFEPRRGRLFLVANTFGERGSFGGVTPFRKTLERKVKAFFEAIFGLKKDGFPWWLHLSFAVVVVLGLLYWLGRILARLFKARVPRFARALSLVAKGGVSGKAAVLSNESRSPALALLELQQAMLEAVSHGSGQDIHYVSLDVVAALGNREPPPAALVSRVRAFQKAVRLAETEVVAGGGGRSRVRRADLELASTTVWQVLAHLGLDADKLVSGGAP